MQTCPTCKGEIKTKQKTQVHSNKHGVKVTITDVPYKKCDCNELYSFRNQSIIENYVERAKIEETISFKDLEIKYQHLSTMEIVDPQGKLVN